MLDLRRGLPGNRLSSFSPAPALQSSGRRVSPVREDLAVDYGCSGYTEVEFRTQTHYDDDDDYEPHSPQLWTTTAPLLPCNHHYSSYPSPKSRLQAIADSRRELIEMLQDLPESAFELSLKDVVEQHNLQAAQKDIGIDERSLSFKHEVKYQELKKKKKKKNSNGGHISRTSSTDSGRVFLLKMFSPIPRGLRKKSAACDLSKVSRTQSLGRPEKTVGKEWWKMRFLCMGESKNSGSSSSSISRHDDIDFTPGCWTFHKKIIHSRQKGCLL